MQFITTKTARTLSPVFLFLLFMGLTTGGAFAARPSDGISGAATPPHRPDVSIWCVSSPVVAVFSPCMNPGLLSFNTIQEAVAVSVAGDEIRIRSGTYTATGGSNEVVGIGIDLTLIGGFAGGTNGWSTPTINPDLTLIDAQGVTGRKSVRLMGNVNVTLKNLALVNGGVGNDSGTVQVTDNYTLRIRSGGTSNGAFSIESGAFVDFTQGTHNLSSGTVFDSPNSGTGAAVVNGATVTALGDLDIRNLTLTTGTLNGETPSNISVSNIFNWNGGTMSGTGSTDIPTGATLNLGGSPSIKSLSGRTVNNDGTVNMSGGTTPGVLAMNNGAVFNNRNNFFITNDDSVRYAAGTSGATFNNLGTGTVRKTGGLNTSQFGTSFLSVVNAGTIGVDVGTLSIESNSSTPADSGIYNTGSSGTLSFSGVRTMGSACRILGNGTVKFFGAATSVTMDGTYAVNGQTIIDAATLILNGPAPVFGGLQIINNGTLRGTSTSVVTGSMEWTAGTISDQVLVITNTATTTGTLLLRGVNTTKTLSHATIVNYGVTSMEGTGTGILQLGNDALFDNFGTFNLTEDESVLYVNNSAQSRFINRPGARLIKQIGQPTTSVLGRGFLAFDNYGTVNVMTGTLSLEGGTISSGGHSGTFSVESGAVLRFNSATHTDLVTQSSRISGPGNVTFSSGTVNIVGTYNITGTTTIEQPGSATTANFDANATTTNLNIWGGTLGSNFAPTFTVSGVFQWNCGSITDVGGQGTIDLLSTSVLVFGGVPACATQVLRDRIFINRGHAYTDSTGPGTFKIGNSAVFTNTATGTFELRGDGNDSVIFDSGTAAKFANFGYLSKSGQSGTSQLGTTNLAFNNYHELEVFTGTLSLDGGTFGGITDGHTGVFTATSLANLRFNGGNHTLQASSIITGAGNVMVQTGVIDHGGTYNIGGLTSVTGGTINYNGEATSSQALLSGSGTIGGFGVLTITNSLDWFGGSMVSTTAQPGPRMTYIAPGATVTIGGTGGAAGNKRLKDSRVFNNYGTITVNSTSPSQLRIGNGATFNNNYQFLIERDDSIVDDGGTASVFNNNGLIRKWDRASGTSQLGSGNLAFNNLGAMDLLTGTLSLDGGTSGGTGGGHTGAFTVTTEAVLRFNSATRTDVIQSIASIVGEGDVEFRSGTVNMGGSYTLAGSTKLTGGTFNVTSGATTNEATMSGGTLSGTGVFTVTGTMAWTAGSMTGLGGRTNILEDAIVTLSTSAGRTVTQRTFNNMGTVTMNTSTGNLMLNDGATFNNIGTFNIQSNDTVGQNSGGASTFNNIGTLLRSAGTGTAILGSGGLVINNTGRVAVLTGVLAFNSTYTQPQDADSADLKLDGGHATKSGTPMSIIGGSVSGTGVITGSLTNTGGMMAPEPRNGSGNAAGQLTVNGNYIQGNAGTMSLELGGTTPGTDYDKVAVTGPATLSGTLKVRDINGFCPSVNMTFTVMTYASHPGNSQFTNLDTAICNGLYALPVYTSTYMYLRISNTAPTPTNTPVGGIPTATSTRTPTPTGTPPTATATATRGSETPTVTPCPMTFTDVNPTDYFYDPVRYLFCMGVISGYSDNTFRPYNNTTRGQLCKIITLAEGWTIDTTGGPHFTDVAPDHPFYPYVETAFNRGVINGYSDFTFKPGNNVTRAQLCKIIVLAEEWSLICPPTGNFSDVPTTDTFYCQIETAFAHGIISGYQDGTFRPGNNATRGQICKIVYQAITQP